MIHPSELHNRLARELLPALVKPVLASGGSPRDVMVLLESVALGVCLYLAQTAELTGTEDELVDQLAAGIKTRWAEERAALTRMAN